ncbi:hypothetical protein HMPREF9406_1457 [Clostridium sp. HGF2]|nr:hypothetical protein HMPREF9406_1457 [Clostridium sp. HGF2]EQJ59013.1 hypothetical protein QSI_1641 [Clostridioides difficile P28]
MSSFFYICFQKSGCHVESNGSEHKKHGTVAKETTETALFF